MCGGQSRRMGEPKALLALQGSGEAQALWAARLLDRFCEEVALSLRGQQLMGWAQMTGRAVILDDDSIEGPMSGVIAALRRARGRACLCVACDMPFLEGASVLRLLSLRDEGRVATCYAGSDGRPEPMLCLYEPEALPRLEAWAERGDLSLRRFLQDEGAACLELVDTDSLASVNTPEEAEAARRRLGPS